jgi:hypothetical protein
LVEQLCADGKLTDGLTTPTADAPKRRSVEMSNQCGARCPNLPKVMLIELDGHDLPREPRRIA